MTLCDTGPLVALIDRSDPHHASCAQALEQLPPRPLLTTWPCWVESMYLLRRAGGLRAQEELWDWLDDDLIQIYESSLAEQGLMRELMSQYEDTPMDLADASLVAAAETLGLREIFSLDKHFHVYRLRNGGSFTVYP